ncbi:sigma-70 family RNA polymerase sigma factor [Paenibacillaceae bacterium WGS1546]|uniref:sigma-70 family RNA polymerase sigma factor n=1 Tax=Cohnella sp. WGS1546 TaxID=3366810 RepID=UPI00372D745E
MDNHHWLAEQFEAHRSHMQSVAYRMLGSLSEADDAVQECWFRLVRSDLTEIESIRGWLTTVVSRVCLDMLRGQKIRSERTREAYADEQLRLREADGNPEQEALLADSVSRALLIVLDTLNPVERISFVLHDIFGVPFTEIAPIVGRTEAATRKLASRARLRVRGAKTSRKASLDVQKALVDSFLSAARNGDLEALLAVLDPNVVLREDRARSAENVAEEVSGARAVAEKVMWGRAKAARPVIVNGDIGVAVAPGGRLLLVLVLAYAGEKIVGIDVVADPAGVQRLEMSDL